MTEEEQNKLEKKALDQLLSGKSLFGKDGAFAPYVAAFYRQSFRGRDGISSLSIFPKTEVQLCIVHQIRNSLKYVASKDQKEFMRDLKKVYRASTKVAAEEALEALEKRWGKKYPVVIENWQNNWEHLSQYFKYTASIRKIIYTTNAVEGFHRQVRKVTKTKGAFASDKALIKLVYLATRNIEKKWTSPLQNWGQTVQQLSITFEGRVPIDLKTTPPGVPPEG